jgi:sugar O-acyltransferase (sialic acid O-acetyltransferase NeuD family)
MAILIVGAGGHAKVAVDILMGLGQTIIGYLDDDPDKVGKTMCGIPVLGTVADRAMYADAQLFLAIGSNSVRRTVATTLIRRIPSPEWAAAIHSRAVVASSVIVGNGLMAAANAVINPDTMLGDHVIVNTGATIDHDCIIGDYTHIAPGSHLGGGVQVGAGTLIGIGAIVIPYLKIGTGVVIGAGAVVVEDVPDNVTVVGVPGHIIRVRPGSSVVVG